MLPTDVTQDPEFEAFVTSAQALGATVTSWCRTPEDNAAVGGVPNSLHLVERGCRAVDLAKPLPPTVMLLAQATGLTILDRGTHWHLEQHPSRTPAPGQTLPVPVRVTPGSVMRHRRAPVIRGECARGFVFPVTARPRYYVLCPSCRQVPCCCGG